MILIEPAQAEIGIAAMIPIAIHSGTRCFIALGIFTLASLSAGSGQ
jgi:hypothetical protein